MLMFLLRIPRSPLVILERAVVKSDNSKLFFDSYDIPVIAFEWEDIKNLNQSFPKYKHIKNLFISTEPMIKTTTAKIKRNEEIYLILSENYVFYP